MGIETNKEFDQIFQDKLQNHEVMPPESVWAGIEASELQGVAASSNWRWWAAASVMAFLLSASAYLYFSDEETTSLNPQHISQQDISNEKQSEIELHANSNEIDEAKPEINNEIREEQSEVNIEKEIKAETIDQLNQMVFEEDVLIENNNQTILEEELLEEFSGVRSETPEKSENLTKQNISEENAVEISIVKPNDETQASQAGRDFFDDDVIDDITSGHKHDKYWVLGLEFSPEWITIPESSNNIESYGLDLSAKYHFSKWFAETGLGVAFSKDNGDYEVEYEVGKFKGSYEDVYNVTFDTASGAPIPTYFTKTVNVYDTIDVYSVQQVENKYAYINIPLNIGYVTPIGKKFKFYAKTGLIASFKIYENIPTPTVTLNGDDIILNPDALKYKIHRSDWHLQAQFNIGLDYYITEKLAFGIEPNARYYIKSLIESSNSGNPYGLGVKIGFKYTLK